MTAVNVILAAEQRGRLVEQGGWNSRKITGQAVDLLVDVRFHQMKDAAFRELIWLRGHTVLHKPVGTQGGGAMSSNGIVVDAHQHTGVLKGGDTTGGPV